MRSSRKATTTSNWKTTDRAGVQTKTREYGLGSFFNSIKTWLSDPKDGLGFKIKCDPEYFRDTQWGERTAVKDTNWNSRKI